MIGESLVVCTRVRGVGEHRRLFHTYVFSFLPLAFYFLLVISFLCDLL